MKKKLLGVVAAGAAFLSTPAAVLAQTAPWQPTEGPETDNLDDLIRIGLNTAIIFAAIVAVFFLVLNGYKYMTAAGDAGKTEEAQKGIANALIGLIICIIAAIVVNYVLYLLGMTPGSVYQ